MIRYHWQPWMARYGWQPWMLEDLRPLELLDARADYEKTPRLF